MQPSRRGIVRVVAAAVMALAGGAANAAEWRGYFTITNLYVAGLNNYQYRLYGSDVLPSCTSSPGWSYLNDSDSGSKGQVAALYAAFYSGRPVRVLLEDVGGFCHILEVVVSS